MRNLDGVHPKLVSITKRALELTKVDFGVIEGLRTVERQRELVKSGASQTMNSKHLTGHAVDVLAYVNGKGLWEPWSLYEQINEAFQAAAREHRTKVTWGGSWKTLKDGVHFEIDPTEHRDG